MRCLVMAMKYKVRELIEKLEQFPPNLTVQTDLAFMFSYPDEIYEKYKEDDQLDSIAMSYATMLCIFEGNWDNGVHSISNLNGDYEKCMRRGGLR